MVALLIFYAEALGYEVTLGEAYRPGDARNHGKRLAIDLNLFKDGEYLMASEAHEPLGLFWESLGGAWGGRFAHADGNHYSLAHDGVR